MVSCTPARAAYGRTGGTFANEELLTMNRDVLPCARRNGPTVMRL